jgi:glucose/arabinose dehydrogenase
MHRYLAAIVIVLLAATPADAQLRATVYVSGFSRPVAFVQDPSDATVQYVAEQEGIVRVIKNGTLQGTPFLDIRSLIAFGGEPGLLGLAFPPNYGTSQRFFVLYTRAGDGNIVVARYKRSGNPLLASTDPGFPLVWSTGDPYIVHNWAGNHNAGCLQFGPDGFLYISQGDGGGSNDPRDNAQDTNELLGKILRIDVDVADGHSTGFVIPAGNPGFPAGTPAFPRPEIWSLGLRNPWRFSFDMPAHGGTGAMLIADVGQNALEEINYEPANRAGRNYGWVKFEGTRANPNSSHSAGLSSTPTFPIHEYGRSLGASVTGGYVYRGSILDMRGRYVYADYVSRRIWSLLLTVNGTTGEATASDVVEHTAELGGFGVLGSISSFGVDTAGELYIVSHTGGSILRLSRVPARPSNFRIVR